MQLNHYILTLYALMGLAIPSTFASQDTTQNHIIDSIKCEIEDCRDRGDFEGYYKGVKNYDLELIRNDQINELIKSDFFEYSPTSRNDSSQFRKCLMFHAFYIKKYSGNYSTALNWYLKAHEHAIDKIFLERAWHIENAIAHIYARINEYDKAIYYYRLCIPNLIKSNNYKNLARLYTSISKCYLWVGDEATMGRYSKMALTLANKSGSPVAVYATLISHIKYKLSKKDTLDVMGELKEISRIVKKSSKVWNYNERISEVSESYGDYWRLEQNSNNAISFYKDAIQQLKLHVKSRVTRDVAKLHIKLAKTFLANNKTNECNKQLGHGLKELISPSFDLEIPLISQINFENTFIDLLETKANYYYKLFEFNTNIIYLDSALYSLDLAFYANDKLGQNLILNKSKYKTVETNKILANRAIEICYSYLKISNNSVIQNKTLKYIDRSKSSLLWNNLKKKLFVANLSISEKNQLNKYEKKLIDLYKFQDIKIHVQDSIDQEILICSEKIKKLTKGYHSNLFVTKIQEGSFIEYIETSDNYFVSTNIRNQKLIKLSNKVVIDNLIAKVNDLIRLKKDEELMKSLGLLYELLIPVDIGLVHNLIFLPDGMINFVPFDILRKNDKYLFESIVCSIQNKKNYLIENSVVKKEQLLYCLNPSYPLFPSGSIDTLSAKQGIERGVIVFLPNTNKEVNGIVNLMELNSRIDSISNTIKLKSDLANYSIFHFAGHAIVNEDSAYLILTDKGQEIIRINQDQIMQMSNNLDLVTLSACETGLGEFKSGEGIRSLSASFLNSGAKSIVYSLWNTNDKSTTQLMLNFYQGLKIGLKKDEALNRAKLIFLENASPEFRSPYYWAAFVVSGDTCELFETEKNSFYKYLLSGILSFFLLIFIFIKHN